jgi:hypothetical protein
MPVAGKIAVAKAERNPQGEMKWFAKPKMKTESVRRGM